MEYLRIVTTFLWQWQSLFGVMASIIVSIVGSIWFQRYVEKNRVKREIFHIVLATRSIIPSIPIDTLRALNLISVCFQSNEVKKAWRLFVECVSKENFTDVEYRPALHNLLVAMGEELGYPNLTDSFLWESYLPNIFVEKTLTNHANPLATQTTDEIIDNVSHK